MSKGGLHLHFRCYGQRLHQFHSLEEIGKLLEEALVTAADLKRFAKHLCNESYAVVRRTLGGHPLAAMAGNESVSCSSTYITNHHPSETHLWHPERSLHIREEIMTAKSFDKQMTSLWAMVGFAPLEGMSWH